MSYKSIFFTFIGVCVTNLGAQVVGDSIHKLEDVQISLYPSGRPSFVSPSSIYTLEESTLKLQTPNALIAGMNTVPGLRMEERSPGSYRLSIRGSLLRSPFGVRNIKIYIDEFPLTDAGGNTYLNALDPGSVTKIELVKGPEGSIYGANTGGVLVINPEKKDQRGQHGKTQTTLGSYGLLQQQLSYQKSSEIYQFKIFQGLQSSEGYRQNSAMKRYFLQSTLSVSYAKHMRIKILGMYSNMNYETPGGLNAGQWRQDPSMARPPAAAIPGAITQKAGIYNKLYYSGIAHEADLHPRVKHVLALFGSISDFKNPFITNYEVRDERNWGLRTYLKWTSALQASRNWEWYLGIEAQQNQSFIHNFGNRKGQRDTSQASDGLKAMQHFYFSRFVVDLSARWVLEAAASLNFYEFRYKNYFPVRERIWHDRSFQPALMPKLATSYRFSKRIVGRISVSKGFSPPTVAEVRPSDLQVYTKLQAEAGWNYETGLRWRSRNRKVEIDAVLFYFSLQNAIVRQVNSTGAEYFINAGKTEQPGAELSIFTQLWKGGTWLKKIVWRNSLTGYRFTFAEYKVAGLDASGRKLTGVPDFTAVSGLTADCKNFSAFVQYNYTSWIPLNDANTVSAAPYHLVQAKLEFKIPTQQPYTWSIFAGADNILNQKYSLGNDLNAFGGRYYNAAAPRNYYAGVSLGF